MKLRYALAAFVMIAAAAQAGAKGPRPSGEVAAVHTMSFTVDAVDPETREVTLMDSEGWIRSFPAWPRMQNLAQVRKGDIVTVSYLQSVAAELKKSTAGARAAVVEQAQRTAPGAKPAGVASREVSLVGTVVGMDQPAGMLAIKNPEGDVVNMAVRNRARLKSVRVGDEVELLYSEAIAVAVTAPTK